MLAPGACDPPAPHGRAPLGWARSQTVPERPPDTLPSPGLGPGDPPAPAQEGGFWPGVGPEGGSRQAGRFPHTDPRSAAGQEEPMGGQPGSPEDLAEPGGALGQAAGPLASWRVK